MYKSLVELCTEKTGGLGEQRRGGGESDSEKTTVWNSKDSNKTGNCMEYVWTNLVPRVLSYPPYGAREQEYYIQSGGSCSVNYY